jgi:uncharacterized protein (DUF58 family)
MTSGWQPTAALVRGATCGLVLALVGILVRRVDVVVIAVPLLVTAAWSAWAKPGVEPTVTQQLDHPVLREGDTTTLRIHIDGADDRTEDIAAYLPMPRSAELDPPQGTVTGTDDLSIAVRITRWGRHLITPAHVVASSAWAGFRWTRDDDAPQSLVALPTPAVFDAVPPPALARGLVGLNRASRPGSGTEFAGIRPFQAGDRLRRIHWPRSLRSGTLHVTSTWAEEDRHVAIVVDAYIEVGESDGIDGRASSLDTAVRAAGAIAEHHLRRGERVSLQVLGARRRLRVPPASGVAHLRRILDRLTAIEPGSADTVESRLRLGVDPGALVVLLSPLVATTPLERAIDWTARGFTVVVIDTLPPGAHDDEPAQPDDDPYRTLAWRIRLLERDREVRRVQRAGVPLVPWRGPGSLDEVLRGAHRRSRGPRMVQR